MATTTIEELARLRRAKAEIKEEIEAKGVEVPSSALLDTYDDYIRQIQGQTEPAVWGGITGDIDDQTDLKEILDGKYEKPATGIPAEDLEDGVIPDVSGFYVKPGTGIPASDLADGVIPDVSDFITKTVNDLANYYLKSETYTQSEVDALIGAISQFHYEIAASTSAVSSPASNVLYLIGPTGSGADKYEEYVYANNTWTKIGDTSIDLSDYVTTSALSTALADYVLSSSITDVLRYSTMSLTTEQKSQARTNIGAGTYSKPSGGIPSSDMASAVQTSLGKADSAYQKPSGGIPSSDMASAVQTSLGKADSAYQKPSGGIPKTDLASAVQTSLEKADSALQSFTETDPTVPAWAKASTKPTYTASEVGALPDDTAIPSDLDDLSDVDLGTPSNGDVLTYNSTAQKWEAAAPTGGGGTGTVNWGNIGGTLANQTDLASALSAKADSSSVPVVTSMSATNMDDIWDSVFGS